MKRGAPKKAQRCDVPLSCFVPEALSKSVYNEARRQRVSVSAFMRDALARHVENSKIAQQKH